MTTGLKANSDGSAAIQVGGTDVITLTSSGAATFVTSPTTVQAGTAAAPAITTSGDTNTGIFFPAADTIAFAEGGVEAMRINSSGDVGINTTSPGVKLHVVSSTSEVARFIRDNTNNASGGVTVGNNTRVWTMYGDNSALSFYDTTAATERARIDSSGKFMVGLTNGTGTINSTASVTISSTNAISGMAFVASGGYGGGVSIIDGTQGYSLWSQTSGADFYIRRSTTTGTYTGGVYISNAAGSWSSASDERLKNIIRPINNAVEKIKDYRCVIGEYKDNPGAERPFLIAQDVQATFPEAVNVMDTENGYLGLSYTEIIPLLTKAIQEQQALITDLQTRLAALEGAA